MNSDSVEAKTPEQILDDAFGMGKNYPKDYEVLKKGMLKKLDSAYASKFIEMLPHKKSPTLGWRKWNRARATGWNAAIDKTERAIKELWDV